MAEGEDMTVDDLYRALDMFKDIFLGACGGIVAYLFDYKKAKKDKNSAFVFSFPSLLINMFLGMFVAYSIGTFIPLDVVGRDAFIGGAGFVSFPILLIAESKAVTYLFDIADRMFGSTKK